MKELYRLRRSLHKTCALRQPPLPPTTWSSTFGPRVMNALDLLEGLVRSCLEILTPESTWLSHSGATDVSCTTYSDPVPSGACTRAASNGLASDHATGDVSADQGATGALEFDPSLLDFFRYPNDAAGMSSPNCFPHIDRGVRRPGPRANASPSVACECRTRPRSALVLHGRASCDWPVASAGRCGAAGETAAAT